MAIRASWKGSLELEGLSISVSLYPISPSTEGVKFHKINTATMHRTKQLVVDAITNEIVNPSNMGRGFEISENNFVLVSDEELDATQPQASKSIVIEKFIKTYEADLRYFGDTYYIVPKSSEEIFQVILKGMNKKNVVGQGKIVLRTKEYTMLLFPFQKGMVGVLLKNFNAVRQEDEYFSAIQETRTSSENIAMISSVIDEKLGKFEPESLVDPQEEKINKVLKAKQKKTTTDLKSILQEGLSAPKKDTAPNNGRKATTAIEHLGTQAP